MRFTSPIALFVATAALASPAAAQGEWGALALSDRSTAYGFAFDHNTQEDAGARALAECGRNARDCRLHTAFRNTCLVLAGSPYGSFGWAWGPPQGTRADRALEQCRRNGGVSCRVVETVCAGTAGGPPAPRNPARAPTPPPPRLDTPPAGPAAAPPTPAPSPVPGAPTPLHRQ